MKASVAATMLLTLAACAGSTAPAAIDIAEAITRQAHPDSLARQMAAELSPRSCASAIVAWLPAASFADGQYARRLTRALTAHYTEVETQQLMRSIDSLQRTLPPQVQAHMLAVATTPERLAAALAADPDSRALAPLIAEEYKADSTLYLKFVNAYGYENL